jgi:hypothetical protein
MLVPALVFVGCFGGGVLAATQWLLAELAPGPVGGIAYFAISGLIGAGLGLVGLHIYLLVRELEVNAGGGLYDGKADLLASGLLQIALDGGTVFGLATIAYLLAPRNHQQAAAKTPAS